MKITVEQIGTIPLVFQKQIEIQFISVKDAMDKLGEDTRNRMRMIIETEKHRKFGSKNNLEKSINYYSEDRGDIKIVGVGSISELNQKAPYWRVVNNGGFIPGRGQILMGNFEGNPPDPTQKGTGIGRESFVMGQIPLYPMKPKSPIWAMNYIEKTINWASSIFRIHMVGAIKKVSVFKR